MIDNSKLSEPDGPIAPVPNQGYFRTRYCRGAVVRFGQEWRVAPLLVVEWWERSMHFPFSFHLGRSHWIAKHSLS